MGFKTALACYGSLTTCKNCDIIFVSCKNANVLWGGCSMAHVEKYKKTQIYGLLRHNCRGKKVFGKEADEHSNKNIRPDLTKFNDVLDVNADFRKRLDEIYIYGKDGKNADKINYLCSWVITAPSNLKKHDRKKFFRAVDKFLHQRYGIKNCVCSVVHYDEVNPHLHYTFIPVLWDEKRKREKLCADDVISRKDLITFHADLSKFVEKELGYAVDITNGATKNGNKTVAEMKKENEQLNADIELKKRKILEAKKRIYDNAETILNKKIAENNGKINELIEYNEKVENCYKNLLKDAEAGRNKLEKVLNEVDEVEELLNKKQDLIDENKNIKNDVVLLENDIKNIKDNYRKKKKELLQYKETNEKMLKDLDLNMKVGDFIEEYNKMKNLLEDNNNNINKMLKVLNHKIAGIGTLMYNGKINVGVSNLKKLMDGVDKAQEQTTLNKVVEILDNVNIVGGGSGGHR